MSNVEGSPRVLVPAALEVEDRIVGSLTFRHLGYLAAAAAGVALAVFGHRPASLLVGVPLIVAGLAGAAIRPGGRPLDAWLAPLAGYRRRARQKPAVEEPADAPTARDTPADPQTAAEPDAAVRPGPADSRSDVGGNAVATRAATTIDAATAASTEQPPLRDAAAVQQPAGGHGADGAGEKTVAGRVAGTDATAAGEADSAGLQAGSSGSVLDRDPAVGAGNADARRGSNVGAPASGADAEDPAHGDSSGGGWPVAAARPRRRRRTAITIGAAMSAAAAVLGAVAVVPRLTSQPPTPGAVARPPASPSTRTNPPPADGDGSPFAPRPARPPASPSPAPYAEHPFSPPSGEQPPAAAPAPGLPGPAPSADRLDPRRQELQRVLQAILDASRRG